MMNFIYREQLKSTHESLQIQIDFNKDSGWIPFGWQVGVLNLLDRQETRIALMRSRRFGINATTQAIFLKIRLQKIWDKCDHTSCILEDSTVQSTSDHTLIP